MAKTKAPTSIRLDAFQREGLARLQARQDRSRAWLVSQAIDDMLELELGLSRHDYEHAQREARGAELLAGFRPDPFRVPGEELLEQRIEALLAEDSEASKPVGEWSAHTGLRERGSSHSKQ